MSENITLADLSKKKEQLELVVQNVEEQSAEITKQVETLTPEQRQKVDDLKKNIDLTDSQGLIQYGIDAQKNISSFSETILSQVKTKDSGYVGDMMTDLMLKVQSLEIDKIDDDGGFFSKIPFLKDATNTMKRFMAKYEVTENQIEKIESHLDQARLTMLKDIGMFDTLYEKNLEYFNELQLYIAAGEEKIADARQNIIPALQKEAERSDDPMSTQLVKDFEDTVGRFEKKVYDLKLSKTIAIQTAPQIKLIQNNDKLLVDKIQTAILNTIPLWKSQIVIALGLQKQGDVLKMQKAVSQTTNDLLKKNAEMLKTNTVEVARESEKGIVEIETLKKVNEDLISTIQETLKIQQEGRTARINAETQLIKMEDNLKQTLLSTIRSEEPLKLTEQ